MVTRARSAALKISDRIAIDMPTFGRQLRSWREKEGLTRSELARLLDISSTHVGNLERDVSPSSKSGRPPQISREMCEQIARVLRVPKQKVLLAAYVPELLDENNPDARTRRMLAVFEDLAPERQDEVIDYLEMIWKRDVAKPPREPKSDTSRINHISDRKK